MDQPGVKSGPKEYPFVTEKRPAAGPGSLTLLRRSKRVLGDVDLGEASLPAENGRLESCPRACLDPFRPAVHIPVAPVHPVFFPSD
jgi:hypothetical protein